MSRAVGGLLAGAGAAAGLALLARWRSGVTKDEVRAAVEAGGTFRARLTGYWPTTAASSEAERRMEGGDEGAALWRGRRVVDPRTGRRVRLSTLEQHLADPAEHSCVSVSADPEAFPWGQRLQIDQWPGAVFRVVDTGGHFQGMGKTYRVLGREPLDVRVKSSRTKIAPSASVAIVKGDHWDRPGEEVAREKFRGQTVAGVSESGLGLLGRGRPA